jgi:VWFA-related protein
MRSSPAARPVVPCGASRIVFSGDKVLPCLLCVFWFFVCQNPALSQDSPQTPAPTAASQPESKQTSAEIATRDEPTTFKVNVKLVVVRAVVRDSKGNAVGSLHQEDFQVFDKGKPQVIAHFEVEQPGTLAARALQKSVENSGDTPTGHQTSDTVPERFVAYMFDDVHLEFGDLAHVREAAERHFAMLRPTDRAAIFTTSGLTALDFTDDHAKLHDTLLHLQPHSIASSFGHDCPEISLYQADLIINKGDQDAKTIAYNEAQQCGAISAGGTPLGNATGLVDALAQGVLTAGEHESRISLGTLKGLVQVISRMPGQRTIVLVSPGFLTPELEYEYNDVIDRAVRSQIVINTLDARGLFVIIPYGDASHQPPARDMEAVNVPVTGANVPPVSKTLLETAAANANDDLLAALSDGTGGIFFHNNNDFDEGFRRVAETPEYSYVLGFVPQNLKPDGSFHSLKVTLKNQQKLTLQARRGYYAPKNLASPEEQAKQEIQEAMYSQEELHNLPVRLHTQFFKASDEDAKLIVLAHVDVQHLHFRKVEGRNNNVLTCVSALFNRNGSFIQGMQKVVTMNLKDDTLEHKLQAGITLKTSFDVKPGSYLVRLVVRDAEGQLMSAENGTVEIR